MIILRQKNYSRFDLTPEEQEIWEKSIKRGGRKPKLKELIQQARKYKKGELSNKEFPNRVVPEMCEPEMCELEMISMINKKKQVDLEKIILGTVIMET